MFSSLRSSARLNLVFFFQLRDIFTIHPHTGCHTHDLLDCPCEGSNKPIPPDTLDNASDVLDDSDPEEVEPKEKGFVTASQIKPGELEKVDRAVSTCKEAFRIIPHSS